ncbi:MAG: hypothetical protein AAF821_26945 [Cyanobacteria bacterium P01_D01_bin.156]
MGILAGLFRLLVDEDQTNHPSWRQKLNPDDRSKTTEERLDELLCDKK